MGKISIIVLGTVVTADDEVPAIPEFQGKYRFLSNFWLCNVRFEDELYKSSEHAYMCQKTTDSAVRALLRAAPTPGAAKKLAKTIKLRDGWEKIKHDIMYRIVHSKFEQNAGLKQQLLDTGNAYLIEGNAWHDTHWGVCKGVGENWLGKILMRVRQELR